MYRLDYRRDPLMGKDANGTTFNWSDRDKDFRSLAPLLTAVSAGDVDLRPFCTESNQFNIGACAGNSTADSVEIIDAIEESDKAEAEGRSARPPVQLSRLFVYAMARGMMDEDDDGKPDIDKDSGTFIRLCFEVLSQYGICDEVIWPYDTAKVFTAPSLKALRQATAHRIHSYYSISTSGEARLRDVRMALRSRHPVVLGTLIDNPFMQLQGPMAPVLPPSGKTEGGHAMVCVGCIGDHFIVKNSWGNGWGDGGYWLMSDEYMAWSETTDLWVPTKGSMFR